MNVIIIPKKNYLIISFCVFLVDSINLRRELFRTRNRLKEAQRELSSQNSLTKHLSTNNLLSSDISIIDLRKDISDMVWEIKNLQKTKETLKHDVEKLEKEILTLESQKKSVLNGNKKKYVFLLFLLN